LFSETKERTSYKNEWFLGPTLVAYLKLKQYAAVEVYLLKNLDSTLRLQGLLNFLFSVYHPHAWLPHFVFSR